MSDDQKEFYIPKNFKAQWEIAPGWGLKEFLLFIPPIAFDVVFIGYFPLVSLQIKIMVAIFVLGLAFSLIHLRPTRENIHAFKHLKWKYNHHKRQKTYYYKKEGRK